MFFYILLAVIAIAVVSAVIVGIKDRDKFSTVVGNSLITLLCSSLLACLFFVVVSALVGSAPATKSHISTENYTIAPNSKFDAADGKLNFVYLKDGTLENYSNYVSEVHLSKDSGKNVQIDIWENFYPGWAPFPYTTTRSATLR